MSRTVNVVDEGSLRRYRTEIPNIVLDMLAAGQIDKHDIALYLVLKRIAGDLGTCWKPSSVLADEAGISAGQLVKSKATLRNAGLINITPTVRHGSIAHDITIVDVWPANMARYAGDPTPARSPGESARSPGESARSPGERLKGEEEPFKKNPKRSVVVPAPDTPTATTVPATAAGTTTPEVGKVSKAKTGPGRTRPAPKPTNPEDREGPFREVFRAICKVRRLNPDLLDDNTRSNTRSLTGKVCRGKGGTEDPKVVEAWGVQWYTAAAKRLGKRRSDLEPPTIAQLTTHFGGCMVTTTGADISGIDSRFLYSVDGQPRLRAVNVVYPDASPFDESTWPADYAEAHRQFAALVQQGAIR